MTAPAIDLDALKALAVLDAEQRRCEEHLRGLDAHTRDKIRRLFKLAGVPLIPTGDHWDVAAEQLGPAVPPPTGKGAKPGSKGSRRRRKPEPREWTIEDVRAKATPIQVRIFSAFVQLGTRTLGLNEIARHARLAPNVIAAAMAPFRTRKEVTGREPLMECHRLSYRDRRERGNLFAITPRHWPLVRRAYANLAPPPEKRSKKASRKGPKDG
ncbi:MAG: hypothetical protein ISS72_06035 [Candidatus Brocadiae bacterium]|nr:hypothetical protein [Candidatus Brocadiia bacterium]